MNREPRPDEAGPQDASEQMTPPAAPPAAASGRKPATDWRVAALVGIVLVFIVVVYINRKYYSRQQEGAQAPRPPSAPQQAQPRGQGRRITVKQEYAALLLQRRVQAAQTVFISGDRIYVMGRPARPVASKENPNVPARVEWGRLFDLTERVEGLSPDFLFRRAPFGRKGHIFLENYPSLGLSDKVKMISRPAAEVTPAEISDLDRVIGVRVGKEARAYPEKLANYHEVINDELAGTPIVVAWSALAEAPSAMERTLSDGTALRFGSAGLIYQGCIVLFDVDTLSLWSPGRRLCIAGKRARTRLDPLPAALTSWEDWKRLHPETTALVGTEPRFPLNYEQNPAVPMEAYSHNQAIVYPAQGFDLTGTPMLPKARVYGVTGPDGKAAKAYELDLLRETTEPFEDTIGAKTVKLAFDRQARLLTATDADDRPLIVEQMFWLYWIGLHPDTEVWQAEKLRAALPPELFSTQEPAASAEPGEEAAGGDKPGKGSESKAP